MSRNRDQEQESRRLAGLLSELLRAARRSVRSVEEQLGLGSSSLGKVLNGTIRLQVHHIMWVTDVLDMTPGQFFHYAYPDREPPHPLIEKLKALQGKPSMPEEPDSPELDARVRRIVLQTLADLLRQQDPGGGSSELRNDS